VVGGALFMQAVQQGGATLLPDRQRAFGHLPVPARRPRTWAERIDHIVLTASGGPFRTRDPATLAP
jgi:1-deoxy-D-xylulose-5-phosphate reductoisomerase